MKNKELFNRTVDILVKAYQNDVLHYAYPCGCAVGSICAAAKGYKTKWVTEENDRLTIRWIDSEGQEHLANWTDIFINGEPSVFTSNLEKAMNEINSTGYTWQELMAIEKSFGIGWGINYSTGMCEDILEEDKQLKGLLAVYDVLCEIHEVNKEEVTKGELVFVR